jgi:DNA-binding LacI/PurR family transcriptional regulator
LESTIYDVAKLAGVSISTVSRVLNEKSNVNKDTRNKVQEAIRILDFYPSISARGLTKKRTRTIGIYEPFIDETFLSSYSFEYFKGVFNAVSKGKYNLLMINGNSDRIPAYVRILKEKRIDGLIMPSVDKNDVYLAALIRENYPIVYTRKRIDPENGYNVYAHFEEYVIEILGILFNKGHKNILFVDSVGRENTLTRAKAIRNFCTDHNINFGKKNIVYHDKSQLEFSENLLRLLKTGKYTAVFADAMRSAQDTINVLHKEGYRIPEDISLVCVEHIKNEAATLFPPISSIYVPAYDMGKDAAELILEVIRNEELPSKQIELSPIYIDRNSIISVKSNLI